MLIKECSPHKRRNCAKLWLLALQYVWRRDLELDIIVSRHLGGHLGRQVAVTGVSHLGGAVDWEEVMILLC